MKSQYQKAFAELKGLGAPVYEHADDDGNFSISAEEGNSDEWLDYWSQYENPVLTGILKQHGLFFEWVNPGRVAVYEA